MRVDRGRVVAPPVALSTTTVLELLLTESVDESVPPRGGKRPGPYTGTKVEREDIA